MHSVQVVIRNPYPWSFQISTLSGAGRPNMRHARIQQRKEPLDFVKAKITHCLVLVQLKKTNPDTTEQEGPMPIDRSPESWHIG